MGSVYKLTSKGKGALGSSGTSAIPLEYRRLLGEIEVGGHVDVIRGRLRRFPDQLIEEWLKELADLQMIEAGPEKNLEDFTFTGQRVPLLPSLADEDGKRLVKTTVV